MKRKITLSCEIPEGVECSYEKGIFICRKGEISNSRKIEIPGAKIEITKNKVEIIKERGNKKDNALIATNIAHIRNAISGLENKFIYEMEICHVHFPMGVKVQEKEIIIDNFLGEKFKRRARILDKVDVEIKGNKIFLSGNDLEKVGQTAANIEKATKVPKKDRKIFQDGIFIVSKDGRAV